MPTPLWQRRFRRWLGPPFLVIVATIAALAIGREVRHLQYGDILRAIEAVSGRRRAAAVGLTLLAYAALPGYDAVALAMIGRSLRWWRVVMSSLVAYAISQTLGFPLLTGGAVRYRYWSQWGLSEAEIAAAVGAVTTTFGIGIIAVGSAALLLEPGATARATGLPVHALVAIGAAGATVVAGYLAACLGWRRPIVIGAATVALPRLPLAIGQLIVALVDWVLAALVFAVLLPAGGPPFGVVLGVFVVAQAAGIVSHLPGGMGAFEGTVLLLLGRQVPAAALVGSLIAFRVIYYWVPFGLGVVALSVSEAIRGRQQLQRLAHGGGRLAARLGRWIPGLVPYGLGAAVFGAGVVLLVSGVTPAIHHRMLWLDRWLPLGLIEASHFLGSLVGSALIVLGSALARRLDAAYRATLALLIVGIGASLLKGLDWEEAAILATLALALRPARRHFTRKAALLDEPLSVRWLVATVTVVAFTTWLGRFAHRHVEYSDQLWWQFSLRGDAPRTLRATVGVLAFLATFLLARLFRIAAVTTRLPDPGELARIGRIVEEAGPATANLALLGDKSVIFSDADTAFLMYRVRGRSWIAMGDPVGPARERRQLAQRFCAEAHRHGGWPVFYEVSQHDLPLYLDLGLTLRKLGEEAIVPLESFSLDGSNRRGLRRTHRDVLKAGPVFAVEPASAVAAILPELRSVSDAWLEAKRTREKGFSLGRFDPDYLCRLPVAVVRIEGRIVAFANLWPASRAGELSMDLMRYRPDAPQGVMTYLFIEMMLWGKAQGFRWFNLGMAPLTGIVAEPHTSWWNRVSAFVGRHGEALYHFQGLRYYKERFDPTWQPRYLASPNGVILPRVLADLTRLVSGGLLGAVRK